MLPPLFAIHWRDDSTVRVASLQSALFSYRDTKIRHRPRGDNTLYTTMRLTVMTGADL